MKGCQPTVYLKKHNLKVENYVFLLGDKTEDLSLEDSAQIALRDCSENVREEPGYIGVFGGKKENI